MSILPSPHVTDETEYKLKQEIVTKIIELAARFPDKNSALIPALHIIQDEFGWVPPETVTQLA